MSYSEAEKGEIRADLRMLYTAGKDTLPDRADKVATTASEMSTVIDSVNSQSASMGDHPVTKDVLNLAIDCQQAVNRAVTTLNNLAEGVVAVADSFVSRDDFARSVFNGLQQELGLTPELGDRESPPVEAPGDHNRENTVADGAPEGPRVRENPDAERPEADLKDRNDEADDNQGDIEVPVG